MAADMKADYKEKQERRFLALGPAAEDFANSLYLEHFEEASFLYEQRLGLFDDPEIIWLDIEDFEDRFEPHIDGLVVGEELALEVCNQQAIDGDFGEFHAAVRVFCRQDRFDLFEKVFETLDFEDKEKGQAFIDALNHELPEAWHDELIKVLADKDLDLFSIAVEPFGYRRLPVGNYLMKSLQENASDPSSTVIWGLGRLREKSSISLIRNLINNEDESICHAASLALLRMGDAQTIDSCMNHIENYQWPFTHIGLGGGSSNVQPLLDIALSEKVNSVCLFALGLLGHIVSVDILLGHLVNEDISEYAAMALNLITGADLYEDIFIPEEIDEDELFDEELEKLKNGEPLYPAGEESGTTITRLSQNQEEWQNWWNENKFNFLSEIRYRNGRPYSPTCLLENLTSEKSPRLVRQMAYEEFVIRYDIDFPFETDMLVADQKNTIKKYKAWIEVNDKHFKDGAWYFAGQLMH